MKAAVIEDRDSRKLKIYTFAGPVRKSGEAVMRVRVSSVNRVDIYMRDNGAGITHQLPLIGGGGRCTGVGYHLD